MTPRDALLAAIAAVDRVRVDRAHQICDEDIRQADALPRNLIAKHGPALLAELGEKLVFTGDSISASGIKGGCPVRFE